MAVQPIPEGYHTVQPYLMVHGATGLIEFVEKVFGATRTEFMGREDGKVMHAEVRIGNSIVMIADAQDPWPPSPAAMYVYVPNVDETFKKAVDAGATSVMEPADQFYGDRLGGVKDRWGNLWWVATRVENVSKEELERRSREYAASKK